MKKRSIKMHAFILGTIFLIGFGPLLIALGAGAFASLNGCILHEGFSNPCVVLGIDFGETLYSMGVMGWMSIIGLPLALLFFVIYLIAVVVIWIRNRKIAQESN